MARLDAALASARLSAWQRNFLTDIRSRLTRYGSRTRLSEKQLRKIDEIIGTGVAVSPLPHASRQRPIHTLRPKSWLKREGRWWVRRFVRDFAFAAALITGFLVYSGFEKLPRSFNFTAPAERIQARTIDQHDFTVTDGDTIRVLGEASGTRLVGFNTPETYTPRCDRERELGNRATARLKEIVSTSSLQLTKVACSCPPGTEGTDACNHGRSCGTLTADGRDVGQILISEGLAVPFVCGMTSCPPTPRPWCD
ncbi:thermonuclease family protein [Ensifer sp. MPMI2T]|nr:thermonuclease family protein [Ensifer sp. MPMI2T]